MSTPLELDFEIADDIEPALAPLVPSAALVNKWLSSVLSHLQYSAPIEINIKVVSQQESHYLNHTYRNKDKPTNVLSFESDLPDFVPSNLIGDLAICAYIVHTEAEQQHKAPEHHWAHMCIHGLLHLLGYDHIAQIDAQTMEAIEVAVLAQLGIDDPY